MTTSGSGDPSGGKRRPQRLPYVILAALIVTGVALAVTLPRRNPVPISVEIECVTGAAVAGAWVEARNGGSGPAIPQEPGAVGASRQFTYEMPFGGPYHLNVGCGGTGNWARSPSSEVAETAHRRLLCDDRMEGDLICRDTAR